MLETTLERYAVSSVRVPGLNGQGVHTYYNVTAWQNAVVLVLAAMGVEKTRTL